MQPLHPAFRDRLLAHHRQLGEANPDRRLTADILNRYEALVSAHCMLRLAKEYGWRFQWPYGGLAKAPRAKQKARIKKARTRSAANPQPHVTPPPFDRLEQATPKTAADALGLVDDTIKQVVSRYMPDFDFCHERWCAERAVTTTGGSNRALRSLFRPPRSTNRGLSALVIIILAVALVGLLTLPFLKSEEFQADSADRVEKLAPPNAAKE